MCACVCVCVCVHAYVCSLGTRSLSTTLHNSVEQALPWYLMPDGELSTYSLTTAKGHDTHIIHTGSHTIHTWYSFLIGWCGWRGMPRYRWSTMDAGVEGMSTLKWWVSTSILCRQVTDWHSRALWAYKFLLATQCLQLGEWSMCRQLSFLQTFSALIIPPCFTCTFLYPSLSLFFISGYTLDYLVLLLYPFGYCNA